MQGVGMQHRCLTVGAVVQLVEYRTRNQEVASSTHTRSTASNLEQVANLLYIHLYSPMNGRKNAKQYKKRCSNLNYT